MVVDPCNRGWRYNQRRRGPPFQINPTLTQLCTWVFGVPGVPILLKTEGRQRAQAKVLYTLSTIAPIENSNRRLKELKIVRYGMRTTDNILRLEVCTST